MVLKLIWLIAIMIFGLVSFLFLFGLISMNHAALMKCYFESHSWHQHLTTVL